jgi:hypothetical protein
MKLTVEVMVRVDVSVNMGCSDSCKPGALLEFAVHYLVRLSSLHLILCFQRNKLCVCGLI